MRKLTATLTLCSILWFPTETAFGKTECNLKEDIKKQEDSTYSYTVDCHKEFGKSLMDLKDREKQVEELNKALDLKNVVIESERDRAQMWRNTSYKLEDRMSTMERIKRDHELLYFGLGILVTIGSGWALGQAAK